MSFLRTLKPVLSFSSRSLAQSNRRLLHLGQSTGTAGLTPKVNILRRNPALLIQARNMFIKTEETPNEDSLKFLPGVAVMKQGGTAEFLNPKEAATSNLAKALFKVDGIQSVFYGPDFITVTKTSATAWHEVKPDIYSEIMNFFTTNQPIFNDSTVKESSDTTINPEDSEVVAMIKELLDTRIRPSIQEDGGDIEYKGFTEEGIVQLKLMGACRTCDSSVITLKNGIENMLMHYIPEVTGVEQATDEEDEGKIDLEKLTDRVFNQ
ncbi:HIRA-interacting protein 5 [Basidiobolus meristosporus CBS 931.73]|uniref:HIRA-interacting protein 5 n=1 Tax=Basidiobolus meristosporus CBS 931.73 TaxID=1314790 RepID=A0A1Y1XVS8_9FUNG|nr:HIRA-interacting protein 5 [Basidiobolus meristosporus CBS 931.73]|eukprot:ORX89775.1 HIRA-interacting protein 5 [Basidiobolus meristosporus CBS 931.73]